MSIIYEALQKTQQNRKNKLEEQSEVTAQAANQATQFWTPRLIALMTFTFVLLLTNILLYYFQSKPAPKPTPPSMAVAFKRTHALNGVFISHNESVAMINSNMVHEGDQIDGMTVITINDQGVKLKNAHEVIMLKSQA